MLESEIIKGVWAIALGILTAMLTFLGFTGKYQTRAASKNELDAYDRYVGERFKLLEVKLDAMHKDVKRNNGLTKKIARDIYTIKRVKHLQQLMEKGQVNSTLKWKKIS